MSGHVVSDVQPLVLVSDIQLLIKYLFLLSFLLELLMILQGLYTFYYILYMQVHTRIIII